MKRFIVYVKSKQAATGLGTVVVQADGYEARQGSLVFSAQGEEVAAFAPGEWVCVVREENLPDS